MDEQLSQVLFGDLHAARTPIMNIYTQLLETDNTGQVKSPVKSLQVMGYG